MIGNKVPLWGRVPNRLLFVGEGPGRQESVEGLPFVGATGAELDYLYLKRAAKLNRDDVAITNLIKWRTDEKDSDPTAEDIARDEPDLLAELLVCDPEIVVAVGRISTQWFCNVHDVDMEKLHGVPIQCPRFPDKILLPVYHPAAGIHQPERYLDKIFWDFQRLGALVRGEIMVETDMTALVYELLI